MQQFDRAQSVNLVDPFFHNWDTGDYYDTGAAGSDRLGPGEQLSIGQSLKSKNGSYTVTFQSDGNVVLYNGRHEPLFATGVRPGANKFIMQTDGNLVVYSGSSPGWSSGTYGQNGSYLILQDDGNFVVYNGSRAVWSSDTYGGRKAPSGSNVLSAIGSAVSAVEHTVQAAAHAVSANPLWDIAKTGISFIPGVGTAVSAGMSAVAAVGQGKSLKDIGLAAARGAIPGGPAVQAAFDVATGLIDGKNITEAVISGVRNQVPGGAAGQAAFDAAIAIGKGQNVGKTLVGAGTNLAASQLSNLAGSQISNVLHNIPIPGGSLGHDAFQKATQAYHAATTIPLGIAPRFPALNLSQNRVARAMHAAPHLMRMPVGQVARELSTSPDNVRRAASSFLNSWNGQEVFDWRDVGELESVDEIASREGISRTGHFLGTGDAGEVDASTIDPSLRVLINKPFLQALYRHAPGSVGTNVRKALLAHGLLARIHHATGELDGAGGWIIRSGDTGSALAKKMTGDANRWREILGVNPQLKTTGSGTAVQIVPWNVGQRITLPSSWLGTAAPAPAPAAPVTLPQVLTQAAAQAASAAAAGNGQATIKQGSTGPAVVAWQNILLANKAGTAGITITTADGQFGPMTDASTRAMQRKLGVTADGVVGPQTWAAAAAAGAAQVPFPASTGPAIPPPPVAVPTPAVPSSANQPALAAAEAMLATFMQFHGREIGKGDFSSSSTAPFGSDPADLAGVWNSRAEQAMEGFQNWRNAHPLAGATPLPETGQPDQSSINALQAQVARDLSSVSPVPIALPSLPAQTTISENPMGNVVLPNAIPVLLKPTPATPAPAPVSTAGASDNTGLVLGGLLLAGLAMSGGKKTRRRSN
jgi:hypothetical protein